MWTLDLDVADFGTLGQVEGVGLQNDDLVETREGNIDKIGKPNAEAR